MYLEEFDVKVMTEKSQESKEIILECSLSEFPLHSALILLT